jgi:hypothetical protein
MKRKEEAAAQASDREAGDRWCRRRWGIRFFSFLRRRTE